MLQARLLIKKLMNNNRINQMDAASVFQKMTAVLHNVNKHAKKFTTITKAIHGGVRSKFKGVDLQYLK